jgi:hypothetical protein
MNAIAQLGAAAGFFGVGSGMVLYEWVRIKRRKPMSKDNPGTQLYWMAYLTFFVLGVTLICAAIFH